MIGLDDVGLVSGPCLAGSEHHVIGVDRDAVGFNAPPCRCDGHADRARVEASAADIAALVESIAIAATVRAMQQASAASAIPPGPERDRLPVPGQPRPRSCSPDPLFVDLRHVYRPDEITWHRLEIHRPAPGPIAQLPFPI